MKTLFETTAKYWNFKTLVVLTSLVALCKILISLLCKINVPLVEDYNIAVNLVSGVGYVLNPAVGPTALKSPGYPLFLSFFLAVFGVKAVWSIAIAQHLLSACYPLLTFKICRKIMSPKAAFLAGALWLVHPSYVYYSFAVEATNLFLFVVLVWLWRYVSALRDLPGFDVKQALILGGLSAACYLVQPVSAVPIAGALLYLVFRSRFSCALAMALAGAIGITPWTIRNYAVFGRFIPGKSPFYMNLYSGFLTPSYGLKEFEILDYDTVVRMEALATQVNDVAMEEHYKAVVLPLIRTHPGSYLKKCLWQAAVYWYVPPLYFHNYTLPFIVGRRIPSALCDVAFLVTAVVLFRTNKRLFAAYVGVMAYFTLVYAATVTFNIRFKLDNEWLIFIAVGYTYDYFFKGGGDLAEPESRRFEVTDSMNHVSPPNRD